jgi:hypothetical protein
MATKIQPLLALELLVRNAIRTRPQLVVQRAEELFHQCVGELAVEVVGALLPAAIVLHIGTPLKEIKVKVRRPPEVLLTMSIVAFRPLMLLIDVRAKASLIRVDHEFLQAHGLLMLV